MFKTFYFTITLTAATNQATFDLMVANTYDISATDESMLYFIAKPKSDPSAAFGLWVPDAGSATNMSQIQLPNVTLLNNNIVSSKGRDRLVVVSYDNVTGGSMTGLVIKV